MKKNLLFIDGQIFQSPTMYRGMGKYCLKLFETLIKIDWFKENFK